MEAWKAFMQSLRLNPDDPWTCLKFGTLLTLCDDRKYARELFATVSRVKGEELTEQDEADADRYIRNFTQPQAA